MSDVPPGTPPPPGSNPQFPPQPPQQPPQAAPPGYQPPPPGAQPPPPPGQPGQPGFAQAPPPGYQPYAGAPATGPGGTTATQFGELAGFGTRFGGWILDGILYGLLMAVFAIPGIVIIVNTIDDNCVTVGGDTFCNGEEGGGIAGGFALMAVGFLLVAFLYIRAVAKSGQTWGRKIVGIKVINEKTGTPPGWGKAIGRQLFASFISAQIFYIGYLWMLWDDKKQTLHDKVAGTHVIRS